MPEFHLRQPEFTYSACRLFTIYQKLKKTVNFKHIYKNELDKACFADDGA